MGIRIYCFRHPEHISDVYTSRTVGTTKQPALLPKVRWAMRTGTFISPGGEDWKSKRTLLQPAVTRANSIRFANAVIEILEPFFARWDENAARGVTFSLLSELNRIVVDWSFKSLFSIDLGEELEEVARTTRYLLEVFGQVTPVWLPTPENLRFRRAAKRLQHVIRQHVDQRRSCSGTKDDLLSLMMDLEGDRRWTDDEIQDEILSIYLGASICAVVLAWTFVACSRHSDLTEKINKEIIAVLARQPPTCNLLESMRYPLMAFQETTRLYPPVWGIPRWAYEPVEIAGCKIPARSLLLPVAYFAHRHPEFWETPNEFQPERFAPERVGRIHPFAYYPFGGGPRMCLGRNLAPLVCQLVQTSILQRYRVEVVAERPGDPQVHFGFEVRPEPDVMARLHRR